MPRRVLPPAGFLVLALAAAPAPAAVPSPVNSSFPPCLVTCPMGDIAFPVTVRDLANNPVGSSAVVLDFSQCPGAFICTSGSPDPYEYIPATRTIRMFTDAAGHVSFPLRVGGVCGAGSVSLYADGVFFASYALASPDQNGSGTVFEGMFLENDFTLFTAKLGTNDPTADFDCDGDVDGDDQVILYTHGSQSCDGWVDAAKRTHWGRVKSFYR